MSHLVVADDGTTNEIHVKPLSRGRPFNSFDCLSYETLISKSKKTSVRVIPGIPQPIPGGIIQTSLPYIFASTLHRPGTPTPPKRKLKNMGGH